MKTGTGSARDKINRLYTFVTVACAYGDSDRQQASGELYQRGDGSGPCRHTDPFVIMRGQKT